MKQTRLMASLAALMGTQPERTELEIRPSLTMSELPVDSAKPTPGKRESRRDPKRTKRNKISKASRKANR